MQTSQAPDGLPPVEQVVPGPWSVPVLAHAFEVPDGVVLIDGQAPPVSPDTQAR